MPKSLWSDERLSEHLDPSRRKSVSADSIVRSPFQQDYDRLLFSAPIRRLSDKTQVWPMDENDGVRTRLTHSHEVANLAKSIGARICKTSRTILSGVDAHEVIRPILGAIGLAHDLGNPPFGHQGEAAIKKWFSDRKGWIFTNLREVGEGLPHAVPPVLRDDFLRFDGNPQSLRLLAKLQTSVRHVGLDLTAATIAAALKYPVNASSRVEDDPVRKKVGYFESEREVVEWSRGCTGLQEGQRHPLTWIMEACDDIAYSVLDVDDAMKKGIVSPDDVLRILKVMAGSSAGDVLDGLSARFLKIEPSRSPEIIQEIKVGYLRAMLMDALVEHATAEFIAQSEVILALQDAVPLMDSSPLCQALKEIAKRFAFSNPSVLRMEAIGASAITHLMDIFWAAISERKAFDDLSSARLNAHAKYAYALISPNYVEEAARGCGGLGDNSVRYKELRLLTDMVSGMTDTFAVRLSDQFKSLQH